MASPWVFAGLLAILAVGGVLFPLVGLSLIVMLALDLALSRFWRRGGARSQMAEVTGPPLPGR
ncbi:hypothetical protein [Aurantimonas coralicida]|uniref:hypothetical protein n=1 Tax=Aurantimonas coralicida TaxID=182270 RepID=UPI001D192C3D|nr:hypothetical protein [Aurantimonas coralicida]MCC4297341.1 hypothetical protein [Aurantimonas coralicida]MDE0921739.1 hypothetical protein [Aurantimonas coralicida]